MFERFTHSSRDVVIRAQKQATELKATQVGSEHLLLALLDDTDGPAGPTLAAAGVDRAQVAAEVQRLAGPAGGLLTEADATALRSVGIDLDAVLERIEESFGPNALQPPARGRGRRRSASRFAPDSKKTLQLALREAIRLKSHEINTGHLLLGLLRDTDSRANRALSAAGLSATDLRLATEAALRRIA